MLACDRCGKETQEKWITSKKTGKQHKLFQCNSGCMEGRFPYSFFPPRESSHASAPQQKSFQPPQGQVASSGNIPSYVVEIIDRLKSLDTKITAINNAMKLGGTGRFTHEEMRPDENVPF